MANDSSGLPSQRNNKKCLLKICLNIDANLQAQQQFPSSPGDTGAGRRKRQREVGRRREEKLFEIGLANEFRHRLASPSIASHIEIEPKVKF